MPPPLCLSGKQPVCLVDTVNEDTPNRDMELCLGHAICLRETQILELDSSYQWYHSQAVNFEASRPIWILLTPLGIASRCFAITSTGHGREVEPN